MDISPGTIMWSPEQHPGWNTMVDIGQADGAKVLVTADDLLRERLGWRFQPATAGVTVVTAAAQPYRLWHPRPIPSPQSPRARWPSRRTWLLACSAWPIQPSGQSR